VGLQSSFFTEGDFPRTKGWATSIKNKIISLLPNLPSGNDESLHKEGVLILKLSVLHSENMKSTGPKCVPIADYEEVQE